MFSTDPALGLRNQAVHRRARRGCGRLASALALLLAVAPGVVSAASPTPAHGTVEVDLRWGVPCPSLLGCDTTFRFTSGDEIIEVGGSLDGMGTTGRRTIRVPVPGGPVTVTMDVASVASQVIDRDDVTSSHLAPIASCPRDLTVPGSDVTLLDARVRRDWPEPSSTTPRTPRPPAWSCDMVPSSEGEAARLESMPPPVVLEAASLCVITLGGDVDGCAAAIAAARATRPVFAGAPLAVASLACGDIELPDCTQPLYAVSFAIRDDGSYPFSDPLYVELEDAGPPTVSARGYLPAALFIHLLRYTMSMHDRASWDRRLATARPGSRVRCGDAPLTGILASTLSDDIAITTEESTVKVTWSAGWTARDVPEGVVLRNADGEVVAREGQLISVAGRPRGNGWLACGTVRLAETS